MVLKIISLISFVLLIHLTLQQRITFTLGRKQIKCFKDDIIQGQILDIFFELLDNFDKDLIKDPKNDGIMIQVFNPDGIKQFQYIVAQETHKSYQQVAEKSGRYKVCVTGSPSIYRKDANAKYEVSI